jgi:Fe-S-cluster containining protein
MPCPFLEDESCSIHPDRPLVCREYLVTSPAELCAGPRRKA